MKDGDKKLQQLLSDLEGSPGSVQSKKVRVTVPRSSVYLVVERCVGCAACMRVCPTEAIRIRKGKAIIKSHLCIDCGECVRVCEHKAFEITADPLSIIEDYEYRIVVPEASVYGQFLPAVKPDHILAGLQDLGFHEAFEAAVATERVGMLLGEYIRDYRGPRPLMSSFCPVVVRLVQLKFPELVDLIVPVDSVLELAIKDLKVQRSKELGIPMERIGAFYLAGCPGRITTIHFPYTGGKTFLDGAIALADIYRDLMFAIRERQRRGDIPPIRKATGRGIRWGALGGEIEALGLENAIAVSEMRHLLRVIQEIDNHMLSDIDYVECRACYGGCAGGPLMVDNPYRGRAKIQMLSRLYADENNCDEQWVRENFPRFRRYFDIRLAPLSEEALDSDTKKAIEKLSRREEILSSLPGIDCGSCGAPNCRALADDVVRGEATIMYCIFKLRDAFLSQKKKKGKPPIP
jgi:ferredoxin